MGTGEMLIVSTVAGAVIGGLVVLGLTRRRVQRRLFRGTGLEEWRQVADRLPWRDRWELVRANAAGRATEPRLARLGVQRAETMIAANDRTVRWRVNRWLITAAAVLAVVMFAVRVTWWVSVGWWDLPLLILHLMVAILLVLLALFRTRLHRRDQRRLRRSRALNAELLDDSSHRPEDSDG